MVCANVGDKMAGKNTPKTKKHIAVLAEEKVKTADKADIKTEPSQASLTDGKSIELVKVDLITIRKLLNAHPVMPVGIDKKANRIINRGYAIVDGSDKIREYLEALMSNSGGLILIKKWIKDSYGFGDGFLELVPNKAKNKVLYLQIKHPVYFGYYKIKAKSNNLYSSESLEIAFDEKTNQPKGFCEYYINDQKQRVPIKEPTVLPLSRIAHLKFSTWGDEIEGTSVLQTVYTNIKQIMNIEDAGAETMYRNGFVQKKFTTNLTSTKKLEAFAKSVKDVNDKDAIILSKDTDVTNLNPGSTDFVEYHEQWLQLLAIALEMPLPLVTQSGTSTNKSTLDAQREDMYEDTFTDELIIKKTIDEQIFAPAIKIAFPNAKVADYPVFKFKPRPSQVDVELRRKETLSNTMLKLARAAKLFKEIGDDARFQTVMEKIEQIGEEDDIWTIRGEFEDGVDTHKNHGLLSKKGSD